MSTTKNAADGADTPTTANAIFTSSIITRAKEKIKPSAKKNLGRHENAVNAGVSQALRSFCDQSEEFARAIVESDKTYDDCLTTICKGLGQSISDFDLYTRAVQFWFPGAMIEYKMTIRMSEYETEEEQHEEPKTDISLSLDSLLDW